MNNESNARSAADAAADAVMQSAVVAAQRANSAIMRRAYKDSEDEQAEIRRIARINADAAYDRAYKKAMERTQ